MNSKISKIVSWLQENLTDSSCEGFVVGVSGGVDSALTSTLCALTGKPVIVVSMPIHQQQTQLDRSQNHMQWLCDNYRNVKKLTKDLTSVYDCFNNSSPETSELALANTASRLRMVQLYSIANSQNLLVAGTGNKVEDYGIGFFTKYGDGGVDISPIADLLKSEVKSLASELKISNTIISATPTDGLWADNRSDEDQIGASYDELEWALQHYDNFGDSSHGLSRREEQVLSIYIERHLKNKHKLETVPVCILKGE